jgi:hypothetical protein
MRCLLLSLIMLTACESGKKIPLAEEIEYDFGSYLVNRGGCVGNDSLRLSTFGNGLYKDQHNRIYFKTEDRSDEEGKAVPVFVLRFPNECTGPGDSIYDLSKKVDPYTFSKIGDGYYRDKNSTYHHTITADGGSFQVIYTGKMSYKDLGKGFFEGSDGLMYLKTQALKKPPEEYGKPFYRMVPRVDLATYQLLEGGGYAKDKHRVYLLRSTTDGEFIEVLQDADVATFKVLGPYTYARDKQHYYEQGRIVGNTADSLNTKSGGK